MRTFNVEVETKCTVKFTVEAENKDEVLHWINTGTCEEYDDAFTDSCLDDSYIDTVEVEEVLDTESIV